MTDKRPLSKIREDIESFDFNFLVNQAAGLNMFKGIVRGSVFYNELLDKINSSELHQYYIRYLILKMLDEDIDERYEHPHDHLIATYTLCLYDAIPPEECLIIDTYPDEFLLNKTIATKHLWWARRIAIDILLGEV